MTRQAKTWLAYGALVLLSMAGLWLILALGNEWVGTPILKHAVPLQAAVPPGGLAEALLAALHHPLSLLLAQVVVIVLFARLCGYVFGKLGQPRVIGEIVAGIALGPSLVGAAWPQFSAWIFPSDSLPKLHLLSQIGLVLFMFIVGMEVNVSSLKARAREAVLVSHISVVLPFLLGAALAIGLFEAYAAERANFITFALFMGIAMSITAFPVLARILMDRGMMKSQLGTMALTCAAVDDVTAWCLLAFIVAVAQAGTAVAAVHVLLLAALYVAVMVLAVRPAMNKVVRLADAAGDVDQKTMVVVLLLVLMSALGTELIGLHALFGAFLAGVIMPAHEPLRRAITRRLEDVSTLILLPLFFAFTGLRTEFGLLDDLESWLICGLIIAIAVIGKLGGSALMARWSGMSWPEAISLGALMNTRGLMELVVLNLGYDLGILSAELFTMMVIMALVTTLMAGPVLSLVARGRAARPDAAQAPPG